MGTIFQPVPDFFLVIETANEPSPSVKPVMNQGFKLKLSLSLDNFCLRFFESLVVEYSCLFRI